MVLAKLDYDRLLTNGMQRHVCLGFRHQQQRRWFPLNRITSKAGVLVEKRMMESREHEEAKGYVWAKSRSQVLGLNQENWSNLIGLLFLGNKKKKKLC
ncbi:hypothetical protein Hdeb2414_s0007g00237051 [Helianthus debilis subsp. tardiflorus]